MRLWNRGLVAALAGCMLIACQGGGGANASRGSGSLALSTDDKYLYAADTDNGIVAVIDTRTQAVIERIAVGKGPTRLAVGSDDTVYVTNRDDRSVSVIRREEWVEAARIPAGVEPSSVQVSGDGRTVYVVNAASLDDPQVGTLQAIDARTLTTTWETKVGAEPKGLALVAGNRAVVSLAKEGTLVEVDLGQGAVKQGRIDVYAQANATKLGGGTTSGSAPFPSSTPFSSFRARGLTTVTATPNGERVFAPGVWAREDKIDRRPSTAGGYYSSGGPCNVGSVATAGVITADTGGAGVELRVDDLTSCFNNGSNSESLNYPPSVLAPKAGVTGLRTDSLVIQGPTAAAVDPTGSFLFVVSREGKSLAVLPTWTRTGENVDFSSNGSSVVSMASLRDGADGIALTMDGKRAYVYNQFDHLVQVFEQGVDPRDNRSKVVVSAGEIAEVAPEVLAPELAAGRKLFFDARDSRMSSTTTNVACSTCHGEGRDDGHVWSFPDGLRQTPALAGRSTLATGPWHWSGEFTAIDDFYNHTIRERMGGSGLTAAATGQVKGWLDSLPAPDNALRARELSEAQVRGAQVFGKAGCNACHGTEALTNNAMADVGTLVRSGPNPDTGIVTTRGFNVPSLRSLARTAPYMHDGSVKTLEARIFESAGDKHGQTSSLSEDEKGDLLVWLKSL